MKQPLFLPAAALACGILAWEWIQPPFYLLAVISIVFILTSFFILWFKKVLLILSLFFIGWTLQAFHLSAILKNDLRFIVKNKPSIVTVRGWISGIPSEKRLRMTPDIILSKFTVQCHSILIGKSDRDNWNPVSGKILVFMKNQLPECFYDGQFVEATGVLKPPPNEKVYGLFSYQQNLRNKYIFYVLEIDSTNDIKVVSENGIYKKPTLTYRFARWVNHALIKGLPGEGLNSDIRQAMLFGWKSSLSQSINDNFMRSGTMHLFAVSGIHVSILSGAILILLRSFLIPRFLCGVIILPVMWFFTSLTGWQASAIRATIMLTIIIVGWMFYRPSNLLNSIFAAGIIILLWQPSQLFQPGFQLSFMAVLSLALILPHFEKGYEYLTKNDPFLPRQLQTLNARIMNNIIKYFGGAVATSLAVFCGTAPLIAYYFNLVTPICIVANLVVIPLGALVLISSLGSVATSFWCEKIAELFNYSGWFWSKCMVNFTEICSNAYPAWFYVKQPTIPLILFYYFLLTCLITGAFFKPKLKYYLYLASGICSVFLIFNIIGSLNTAEVDIISFRNGHSIYIDSKKNNNSLIDCGNDYDVRALIEPLMISRGANGISKFFLSHGDSSHIGGATNLSKIFRLETIYTPRARFRSRNYREAVRYFTNNLYNLIFVKSGDKVGEFEVLYPLEWARYKTADDSVLVLRANLFNKKVLFLSDLSADGIKNLKYGVQDIKADILVISQYDVSKRVDSELLDFINPGLIIFVEWSRDSEIPAQTITELEIRHIKYERVEAGSGLTLLINKNGWRIKKPRQYDSIYPQFDEM